MKPVVIAMPGNEQLADELAAHLSLERGAATVRRFPDGESHARVESSVQERDTFAAPRGSMSTGSYVHPTLDERTAKR